MKRTVYLVALALVAMMVLVPSAFAAQETMIMKEDTMMIEQPMMQPLPKSGGPVLGSPSVLLPAAALLLGSGVLAFAVLRRR